MYVIPSEEALAFLEQDMRLQLHSMDIPELHNMYRRNIWRNANHMSAIVHSGSDNSPLAFGPKDPVYGIHKQATCFTWDEDHIAISKNFALALEGCKSFRVLFEHHHDVVDYTAVPLLFTPYSSDYTLARIDSMPAYVKPEECPRVMCDYTKGQPLYLTGHRMSGDKRRTRVLAMAWSTYKGGKYVHMLNLIDKKWTAVHSTHHKYYNYVGCPIISATGFIGVNIGWYSMRLKSDLYIIQCGRLWNPHELTTTDTL